MAAARIVGQSESDPITIPTRALTRLLPQVGGPVAGPPPDVVQIVTVGGDVTDLAAGDDRLAVELHPQRRVAREHLVEAGDEIGARAAQHVVHDGPGRPGPGEAERKVADGPQMVLELRGVGAVDRPVTRVVRPHRQLVDDDVTVGVLHQLDREDAGHVELRRDLERQSLAGHRLRLRQPGCRRGGLDADPVQLHRLRDGVGDGLTVRRPGHDRRQLPHERDVLLGDDLNPGMAGPLASVGPWPRVSASKGATHPAASSTFHTPLPS